MLRRAQHERKFSNDLNRSSLPVLWQTGVRPETLVRLSKDERRVFQQNHTLWTGFWLFRLDFLRPFSSQLNCEIYARAGLLSENQPGQSPHISGRCWNNTGRNEAGMPRANLGAVRGWKKKKARYARPRTHTTGLCGKIRCYIMPPMPPIPPIPPIPPMPPPGGIAGIADLSSGFSATIASVVRSMLATDAAF